MAVTVERFRSYLNLPPDSTEDLSLYITAAKDKARAAGIPDYTDNAQHDLFIYALAAMYYDNRGFAFTGSYQAAAEENARRLFNSFVLELRHGRKQEADDG